MIENQGFLFEESLIFNHLKPIPMKKEIKTFILFDLVGCVLFVMIMVLTGCYKKEDVTILGLSDPKSFNKEEKEMVDNLLFDDEALVDVVTLNGDTLKAAMLDAKDVFAHMQVPVDGILTTGDKLPLVSKKNK